MKSVICNCHSTKNKSFKNNNTRVCIRQFTKYGFCEVRFLGFVGNFKVLAQNIIFKKYAKCNGI